MATLTIRNLPEDLVERLKSAAAQHGRSMEQELRELLMRSYPDRPASLERIRARWGGFDPPSAEQIDTWIESGRA